MKKLTYVIILVLFSIYSHATQPDTIQQVPQSIRIELRKKDKVEVFYGDKTETIDQKEITAYIKKIFVAGSGQEFTIAGQSMKDDERLKEVGRMLNAAGVTEYTIVIQVGQ